MESARVSPGAESDPGFSQRLPALFALCRRGDRIALNQLVEETQSRLFGVAYAVTRSREDALDVVQETYIRLLSRLDEIREPAALPGWLTRTTVNLAIDALRRRKVRKAGPLPEPDFIHDTGPEAGSHGGDMTGELRGVVLALADELSPQQRLAFLLRDIRGLSMADVADGLECTVGAVKAHLSLARAKLRAWLKARHPEFLE